MSRCCFSQDNLASGVGEAFSERMRLLAEAGMFEAVVAAVKLHADKEGALGLEAHVGACG